MSKEGKSGYVYVCVFVCMRIFLYNVIHVFMFSVLYYNDLILEGKTKWV